MLNLSPKKLLATEDHAFNKARISILFIILQFALLKIAIVVFVALQYDQPFQLARAAVAFGYYTILLLLLLQNKSLLRFVTHLMVIAGVAVVWTNIFISVQSVNITTLQFVFMIVLSSFYLLDKAWGIFYSCISIAPIIIPLVLSNLDKWHFSNPPEELAYPGSLVIIVLNFVTIIVAHYLYHQAFSSNMEEKLSLNERLKEAVEEANKHAQSKSDFLSVMSHELRTPLNMVIGMTELLLDSSKDKEQRENLRIMKFSASSLHTLINDILDFNKLDSGKLGLESIKVNLYELIHNICAGLELQAKEKGLQLIIDIDERIKNQPVMTDPMRITQIIYNLVGNGIKFTAEGSVTIELKPIARGTEDITILFSVKDTGIGISPDKHEAIFEPFTQASTNTTRNYGGTGLGLSIVKKLLALFNSEINLESAPARGSHFFFGIHFKTASELLMQEQETDHSTDDLKNLRLLAAEDNPLNTFLLNRICMKWGVELTVVTNGTEAIDAVEKELYDVILMDIHMPGMDGYEATKVIRNMPHDRSGIPIIALTASVSDELELRIREAGMNDYMRKPFNNKELYQKLKSFKLKSKIEEIG